jgi:Phosphotransferase enzyme family
MPDPARTIKPGDDADLGSGAGGTKMLGGTVPAPMVPVVPIPPALIPEAITAGWLAAVLRANGCDGSLTLSNIRLTRIGRSEGFSGCRIDRIEYDASHPAPRTLIVKQSPRAPDLCRRLAPANHREIAFYAGAGPGLPVPRCLFAGNDRNSGQTILILEDFGEWVGVPFGRGLSGNTAALAVAALARVHVQEWGKGAPDPVSELPEFPFATLWPDYMNRLRHLIPDVVLPDRLRALGDHIAAHPSLLCPTDGPLTRVHRDAQADNLRFGPQGAVILDWQMTGYGPGARDVGYLLISSLRPATRRRHETALLQGYLAALGPLGRGIDLHRHYRASVAGKLWMTVGATMLFDNDSPAKRAWRRTDLLRLIAFCDDHALTPAMLG